METNAHIGDEHWVMHSYDIYTLHTQGDFTGLQTMKR